MEKMEIGVISHYTIECLGKNGKLKWKEMIHSDSVVTFEGMNKLFDACFKSGLRRPAWYVLLKNSGRPDVADTMASHASWTENTMYSNASRPAFKPGPISYARISNIASKASFRINGTTTIYGAGLVDDNTVGGTSGTLYGVGNFRQRKLVREGDILNVSATLIATPLLSKQGIH